MRTVGWVAGAALAVVAVAGIPATAQTQSGAGVMRWQEQNAQVDPNACGEAGCDIRFLFTAAKINGTLAFAGQNLVVNLRSGSSAAIKNGLGEITHVDHFSVSGTARRRIDPATAVPVSGSCATPYDGGSGTVAGDVEVPALVLSCTMQVEGTWSTVGLVVDDVDNAGNYQQV
jgi:hypothetical protein